MEQENQMSEPNLSIDSALGILLTKSGYDTLQAELENLTVVKRPDIANRIRESQQHGEFSEDNNELDEVKFEQAIVETRIAELKTLFSGAIVLEKQMIPTDHVGIGSAVTITDKEWNDTFQIRIVSSFEADPKENLISSESPMGMALLGAHPSEEVSFMTPDGKKKYIVNKITR